MSVVDTDLLELENVSNVVTQYDGARIAETPQWHRITQGLWS